MSSWKTFWKEVEWSLLADFVDLSEVVGDAVDATDVPVVGAIAERDSWKTIDSSSIIGNSLDIRNINPERVPIYVVEVDDGVGPGQGGILVIVVDIDQVLSLKSHEGQGLRA